MTTTPRSGIEGLAWPALPGSAGNAVLALLYQLEQSQWWPAEALRAQQLRQAQALLRHAVATVPHYRQAAAAWGLDLQRPLREADWGKIPILRRQTVQQGFEMLRSEAVPKSHGGQFEVFTSGSTAMPVRVLKSQLEQVFWRAFTLREHLWHRRDLRGKLAVIRPAKSPAAAYPKGIVSRSWGVASGSVFQTGLSAMLDISSKLHEQAAWLRKQNPDYLLTYPSNLDALAHHCLEQDIRLPRLKQVQAISELLYPEVRDVCQRAFGVPVVDDYSAQETGYIAVQCPDGGALHVQAEAALVEVVDSAGRPCAPGEVGEVVVTPLHNFAMPLIRYAVGDLAEVGPPCACGRGLPVLSRVLGRVRAMVRLPNGEQHYPSYQDLLKGFEMVRQFQIVRRAEAVLEMKLVTARPLSEAEAQEMADRVRARFRYPFEVAFSYHEEIPRSPGGKFQDYIADHE